MLLEKATLLIPMNQQMEILEGATTYKNGQSNVFDQFENFSIKPQENPLQKVYL